MFAVYNNFILVFTFSDSVGISEHKIPYIFPTDKAGGVNKYNKASELN